MHQEPNVQSQAFISIIKMSRKKLNDQYHVQNVVKHINTTNCAVSKRIEFFAGNIEVK